MQKRCINILFAGIMVFGIAHTSFAQNGFLPNASYVKPITAGDSLLLHRYIDNVNNAPFFSHKRQRYYDSALMIKPWNAHWWQQKAMVYYKLKKYEAGSPYLDSAVKYDARAYIDYRAFMKCIFQKSYKDATRDFELAKVIVGAGEVMDHSYDFYLGLCFLQLNQLDSAEYYLVKTTAEQKRDRGERWVHPLDWFYLGLVYYEKEDYAKAAETFERSLKLYTTFSDAKYYKALCLKKSGKGEAALALMTEANDDFKKGYTINEDNVDYETYPYQVYKPAAYDNAIKWLAGKED